MGRKAERLTRGDWATLVMIYRCARRLSRKVPASYPRFLLTAAVGDMETFMHWANRKEVKRTAHPR